MKATLLALPIILSAVAAGAQEIVPLEIVRLENVQIKGMPAGLSPTISARKPAQRLDETGGGYEQDTISHDGPILYGTGMNDQDRQKAWDHFFMQMVEAVGKQQGTINFAKRCMPGQEFCTMSFDANLVGVGGIQEPRKVVLLVIFDFFIRTDSKEWFAHFLRRGCRCVAISTPAS
jgi:hypothetical protein